jgi:putative ABC transport system substrate-binding protein
VREFAEAGELMSYGANLSDMQRQLGIYTGRIFKGAKPADFPVVQ